MDKHKIPPHVALPPLTLSPIWEVILKWYKQIAVFILAAMALATVAIFILPNKYYSRATLLPTNPVLSDRSRLFNKNIEGLYSVYGTGDDLDRLCALANTHVMYKFLSDSFKLTNTKNSELENRKIILKLQKSIELIKSANGELVIGVWTKDRFLSAKIANAFIAKLKEMSHQALIDFHQPALNYLQSKNTRHSSAGDSTSNADTFDYQTPINEINTTLATAPPPFIVTDIPEPAVKAGKPDTLLILLATFFGSLLFAAILVVIIDKTLNSGSDRQPDII